MFNKLMLISLCYLLLIGCREGRGFFEFNASSAGYYTGAVPSVGGLERPFHLWFGPYRIRQSQGRYIGGPQEFYEKGPLPDSQINAWWQVHYKDKADKFFYARSLPDQGIQAETMHFWSNWKYYAYISFGPMYIDEDAVNEMQYKSKHLMLIEISKWSGLKYFTWGEESSVYYKIERFRVNPQREVIEGWVEVPGISITEKQFLLLNTRCGKPWLKTRCFMDESFPDLTPEQLDYIKAHKHEVDEYWLSDKAEPPEVKESVNYWL